MGNARKLYFILLGMTLLYAIAGTLYAVPPVADERLTQEQAREIVSKIYHEKLAREPDTEGLRLHMQLLIEEGKSPEWLATALENSKEGRILKKSKKQILFGIAMILLVSLFFLLAIWLSSKRSRWIPRLLYVAWIILLIEAIIRIYFTTVYRVDFFHPEQAIKNITLTKYAIPILSQQPKEQSESKGCRVLLLGASVLDPVYGTVLEEMKFHLSSQGIDDIKIFNFSKGGHSTRDSRIKFVDLLDNYQFDFVVIYHGINEVRANNCPDDIYRENYSHYVWYDDVNISDRHLQGFTYSFIPYTADLFYHLLRHKLFPEKYIPTHEPLPEWVAHGAKLKTPRSFRSNLEAIIQTARSRSTKVILMTFAYYVPPGYTRKAFDQKTLGYVGQGFPIEMWGKPENVINGIKAHNSVVRELAEQNKDVFFLDMEKLLPKEGKYFRDICHPSSYGNKALAGRITEQLVQQCEKKE